MGKKRGAKKSGRGRGGGAGAGAGRGAGGGAFAALAGDGDGDEEEEDDPDAPSAASVEQQRQLLEMYSKRAAASSPTAAEVAPAGSSSPGGGASGGSGGAGPSSEEVFAVRHVKFYGREVPVLLQNRNGPCALLAVANGLLLRGTLTLKEGEAALSSSALIERLGCLCRDLNAKCIREDANAALGVSEVIGRLPLFLDGLLLNCGFGSCSDVEFTCDLSLFDCLGLRLYHAWVAPEVSKVAPTFNALSEQLAICAELRAHLEREGREPTPEEDSRLATGLWLEQWLEETRAQATVAGLQELLGCVGEREVCVLFRNNHFSTIYKPSSEALCVLLTDAWFAEEANAVWESIELDGSTGHILGADFRPAAFGSDGGQEAEGPRPGRSKGPSAEQREDLVSIVQSMGFSREMAEAGLAASGWAGAQEAVEAILEADGALPVPKPAAVGGFSEVHRCPTCDKVFRSKNGLLNHRVSKSH